MDRAALSRRALSKAEATPICRSTCVLRPNLRIAPPPKRANSRRARSRARTRLARAPNWPEEEEAHCAIAVEPLPIANAPLWMVRGAAVDTAATAFAATRRCERHSRGQNAVVAREAAAALNNCPPGSLMADTVCHVLPTRVPSRLIAAGFVAAPALFLVAGPGKTHAPPSRPTTAAEAAFRLEPPVRELKRLLSNYGFVPPHVLHLGGR